VAAAGGAVRDFAYPAHTSHSPHIPHSPRSPRSPRNVRSAGPVCEVDLGYAMYGWRAGLVHRDERGHGGAFDRHGFDSAGSLGPGAAQPPWFPPTAHHAREPRKVRDDDAHGVREPRKVRDVHLNVRGHSRCATGPSLCRPAYVRPAGTSHGALAIRILRTPCEVSAGRAKCGPRRRPAAATATAPRVDVHPPGKWPRPPVLRSRSATRAWPRPSSAARSMAMATVRPADGHRRPATATGHGGHAAVPATAVWPRARSLSGAHRPRGRPGNRPVGCVDRRSGPRLQ